MLVPVYMLSGDSLTLPIYIALTLLSMFTCLTAYLIYRIARRYVGETASMLAAVVWAFSPVVTRQTANGLETALTLALIAGSVYYYLSRIRPADPVSPGRFLKLGLLLGLTVLARIDSIFLVLVILLDYLVLLRRRGATTSSLGRLSLLPAGVVACYGPWLIFTMILSGTPLQDSGSATRFLSLAYASYFGYGSESLVAEGPDADFIRAHIIHSISTLKVIPPVHVLFRSLDRLGDLVGGESVFRLLGNLLGIITLIVVGLRVISWKRDPSRASRSEVNLLLLFGLLLMLSYTLYIFGAFFFLRYFFPIYMIACIYLAFLIQDAIDWLAASSVSIRRLALTSALIYTALFSYFAYSQAFRTYPMYPFYNIARWVDTHTKTEEKIGVFQCGTIAYFSDRQVINLDGKVNRQAFEALRSQQMKNYILREGIDVVIDHADVLEIFLAMTPQQIENCCTKIMDISMARPPDWVALQRASIVGETTNSKAIGNGSTSMVAPLQSRP
jgi:hypothetical protein